MLRFRTDTSIQGAFITVVCSIRGINDVHNEAFAIANFALAISCLLQGDCRTHCRKTHGAGRIYAGKCLAFAASTTFGIRGARHTGRRRTAGGTRRTSRSVFARFGRARSECRQRQSKKSSEEFRKMA